MDPYSGPRDVPGEDDGQPLTGPYDERQLPPQGDPLAPRCHGCNKPRERRGVGYVCPHCDETGVPPW